MVVAPEHPLIEEFKDKLENIDEIEAYRRRSFKEI